MRSRLESLQHRLNNVYGAVKGEVETVELPQILWKRQNVVEEQNTWKVTWKSKNRPR